MKRADGIIVVTPEYNRSIPGVLKNIIDWTSRPYGDSAWAKKPVAVTGASGRLGTSLAQTHVKQILNYLDTHVMGQPELYVDTTGAIDADSNIADEKIKGLISAFIQKFDEHIKIFQK
jgi:chromate reductase